MVCFPFSLAGRADEFAQVNLVPQVQTKNYFKNVSENKEIAKLVSLLSTCVMSTKKVCWPHSRIGQFRNLY